MATMRLRHKSLPIKFLKYICIYVHIYIYFIQALIYNVDALSRSTKNLRFQMFYLASFEFCLHLTYSYTFFFRYQKIGGYTFDFYWCSLTSLIMLSSFRKKAKSAGNMLLKYVVPICLDLTI